MSITLRDATAEDDAFLREVYASSRADEFALAPWGQEQREAFLTSQFRAQHSHYHQQYPQASYQVILVNCDRAGRLYVLREKEHIQILDITVLPQYRRAGIGTSLIRMLLDEGARTDITARIWVESFNPSRHFFERLGFFQIQEDGFNCLLECRSPPGP